MMTVLLLVTFAAAVVGLLVVTPALERWATTAPGPFDAATVISEPLEGARQA